MNYRFVKPTGPVEPIEYHETSEFLDWLVGLAHDVLFPECEVRSSNALSELRELSDSTDRAHLKEIYHCPEGRLALVFYNHSNVDSPLERVHIGNVRPEYQGQVRGERTFSVVRL